MQARLRKAVSRSAVDPLVQKLTRARINKDIQQYLGLLNAKLPEARLQEFLASHSYFFNGVIRLFGQSPLYSKIRLGSQYEIDFVCFDAGSYGPDWRLIEIEPPSKPMLKKSGEPSAYLLHAIAQVRSWQDWIHENVDYARKLMPHIDYPLGYVFVGRRASLTKSDQKKIRRLAYDHRHFVKIHTLDRFAAMAGSVGTMLRGGNGFWPLGMNALTHRDLSQGLPERATEWLNGEFSSWVVKRMRADRIEERAHDYWDE
jgi:Domain of unknown function (DUF4263)